MTGTVVDIVTGKPVLASVDTIRNGQRFGTVTNDAGQWSYPFDVDDQVKFSGVGLVTFTVPARTLGEHSLVEMEPSTTELDPFTVTGTRKGGNLLPLLLVGAVLLALNSRRRS